MQRKGIQAWWALVLVLGGLPSSPLEAETIVLAGHVRTLDGAQLPARTSILRSLPRAGIETHDTASDGSFSIATSREGIQVVRAGATGYAGSEAAVSPTGPQLALNFQLAALRLVEGTVRSHEGVAQAGVPVRICYVDSPMRMRMDEDLAAVTDQNGTFALLAAGDGGGRFVVEALPDDWVPTSSATLGTGAVGRSGASAADDPAIRNLLIELQARGARISGTVTSPAGRPLSGIIIRAVVRTVPERVDDGANPGPGHVIEPGSGMASRPFAQLFTRVVETDRSGQHALRGLPPGVLTVSARSIGQKPAVRTLPLLDGAAATVDFAIQEVAVATQLQHVAPGPPPPPEP